MVIDNRYEIGEIIYLKTDNDQLLRLISGIMICGKDIMYEVSHGTTTSKHYEFELTPEVNILAKE